MNFHDTKVIPFIPGSFTQFRERVTSFTPLLDGGAFCAGMTELIQWSNSEALSICSLVMPLMAIPFKWKMSKSFHARS